MIPTTAMSTGMFRPMYKTITCVYVCTHTDLNSITYRRRLIRVDGLSNEPSGGGPDEDDVDPDEQRA